MATTDSDKLDAGLEQLHWAAVLFIEHGACRAATTLAGAAEELLGKSVHGRTAFHVLRNDLAELSGEQPDTVGTLLNVPRNWLKHGSNPPADPDWPQHAAAMIVRAAINLQSLGVQLPPSVLPVLDWIRVNCPDD